MHFMDNVNYITSVAHLGIAVPDVEEARAQFELLGYQADGDVLSVESHGVRALMMHNANQAIELLAPLKKGEPSPLDSYIATKPYKIYHIAYYVSDFDEQVALMKKQKYIMVDEPARSEAQGGKRTVFMFNRKVGIVELVEQ